MTEKRKYEYYDSEKDTYTFRGEVLHPERTRFEVVYRSESYELRRVAEVELDQGDWERLTTAELGYGYEVLEKGEVLEWWQGHFKIDRDAYDLIQECERVECVGR